MDGLRIRMHPTLDILCREDGAVMTGKYGQRWKPHWTFGWNCGEGYKAVEVEGVKYRVHRLIAETFVPNPHGKKEVDHINRDKSCNFASNLRWADDFDQQNNMDKTDATIKAFGVRARDDKNAWTRAYNKARKECLARGEKWVAPRYRKNTEQ